MCGVDAFSFSLFCGCSLAETINDILRKLPEGMTLSQLALQARMSQSYLNDLRRSGKRLSEATAQRLMLAVQRIRSSELEGEAATNALYRSLLVVAANELQLDPLQVQMVDPRAKRTSNVEWLACVQAHWLARWCMNQVFGIPQAVVARSMGVTKQAVNQSLQSIFEREDQDEKFSQLLVALREKLMGISK